jgi:hypothetical protein
VKPEEFLKRNPWCSEPVMKGLFPYTELDNSLERNKIQSIPSPWGPLMALPNEEKGSAINLYRLESARQFALLQWGPKVVQAGISPGPTSTARYGSGDHIWDVFVDPGCLTPEGIDFIRRPPISTSETSRLILASHSDRVAPIIQCVRSKWIGAETWVGVSPISPFDPGATPSTASPLERVIPNAFNISVDKKPPETPIDMQRLFAERLMQGGPSLVFRLSMVGNCPLLSLEELAILEKDISLLAAWKKLKEDGWLLGEERMILSPKALTLLGLVWGASAQDLLNYHPWPLTVQDNKLQYQVLATDWHAEHFRMVRQLCLSFIDGARRLSKPNAPSAHLESMVSSRLSGVTAVEIGKQKAPNIIDAFLHIGVPAPHGIKDWDILLGIDRGTFLLTQQEQRILKQQDVWQEQTGRLVTQFWIFADPVREESMLNSMKTAKIPIWSTTIQRLRLDADDSYWINAPAGSFPYGSVSGFAPFRPIWMQNDPTRPGVHSLLDYQPD